MVPLAAGQVVIVHFSFSDLTEAKLRPAAVLAEAGRMDWILSQITSKSYGDARAVLLEAADFYRGSLRLTSYVRPGKFFTAHTRLVAEVAGELRPDKFSNIRDAVVRMIRGE